MEDWVLEAVFVFGLFGAVLWYVVRRELQGGSAALAAYRARDFTPAREFPQSQTTSWFDHPPDRFYGLQTGIAVDTSRAKVCFAHFEAGGMISGKTQVRNVVYSYRDVISVELIDDGVVVDKTSNSSMLGRALIGNIAAGGAGLIVGGLTAKRTSAMEVTAIELKVLVNDIQQPVHIVNFVREPVKKGSAAYRAVRHEADEWKGILDIFVRRAEHEMRAEHAVNASHDAARIANHSVAHELKELHDLKERGVITPAEFEAQKSRILSR